MSARLGLRRTALLITVMAATSWMSITVAQAWMTAQGTGSGAAASQNGPLALAVSASGTIATPLVPGGTGDLVLTVSNPNDFPVHVTSVSASGPVVVNGSLGACSGSAVTVAVPAAELPVVVPAGAVSLPLRFVAGTAMAASADQGCQGATFQIPLSLGVRR